MEHKGRPVKPFKSAEAFEKWLERAKRISDYVAMLAEGRKLHP